MKRSLYSDFDIINLNLHLRIQVSVLGIYCLFIVPRAVFTRCSYAADGISIIEESPLQHVHAGFTNKRAKGATGTDAPNLGNNHACARARRAGGGGHLADFAYVASV